MADLIERLREYGCRSECERHEDRDEAAAEIEKLRAKLAEAEKVIAPFGSHALDWSEYDDSESLIEAWAEGPDELPLKVGHLRAAAEWMEKGE